MSDIESEKARLEALIASGYHGGTGRLMHDHSFSQLTLDRYYMPLLRKYKSRHD